MTNTTPQAYQPHIGPQKIQPGEMGYEFDFDLSDCTFCYTYSGVLQITAPEGKKMGLSKGGMLQAAPETARERDELKTQLMLMTTHRNAMQECAEKAEAKCGELLVALRELANTCPHNEKARGSRYWNACVAASKILQEYDTAIGIIKAAIANAGDGNTSKVTPIVTVKIEVQGGVAEATTVPAGVEVQIVDHDDIDAEAAEAAEKGGA